MGCVQSKQRFSQNRYLTVTSSTAPPFHRRTKPVELATNEERLAMERKEHKQKEFFAAMEQNVLRNLSHGSYAPPLTKPDDEERDGLGQLTNAIEAAAASSSHTNNAFGKLLLTTKPSRAVRTISSMDQNVLAELTRVEKENMISNIEATRNNNKVYQVAVSPTTVIATSSTSSTNTFDFGDSITFNLGIENHCYNGDHHSSTSTTDCTVSSSEADEEERERAIAEVERVAHAMAQLDLTPCTPDVKESRNESSVVSVVNRKISKPVLRKRNTCSTLYVGSTMSEPDKDATIKCICGVFRAHLLQAVDESSISSSPTTNFEEYSVFDDVSYSGFNKNDNIKVLTPYNIPSLDEITNFYRDVFNKSQMEADCIIMSLIYVERLIKETNGGVRPHPTNWRSILFSSMILASKVWDDLSMWNSDFCHCVGGRDSGVRFSLQRINILERAMLGCLKYNVKVLASEYAKYYFLLRSMLIRSGLGGKELNSVAPLDIEGARQMQLKSANAERTQSVATATTSCNKGSLFTFHAEKPMNRRSKSLGNDAVRVMYGSDSSTESAVKSNPIVHDLSPASVRAHLEQIVHM